MNIPDDPDEQLPPGTDHTFEPVPDNLVFPEELTPPWNMDLTLEPEFPEEPPTPWYENNFDHVLRVPVGCNRAFAGVRLLRMASSMEARPVGDMFTTARFHCLRVRKK